MPDNHARARWLDTARLVVAGHREGLPCPENEDADLEVTWAASQDQAGGEYWLRCPGCGAHNEIVIHDHQPISGLQAPEPWYRPQPQLAAVLAAEAQAEVGPEHELAGRQLAAVVRCGGCDEVIFSVDDGTFAQIHLTWARHPEPEPLPATLRLGGFLALEIAIDNHRH
jgi:hypothetical protein